MSYDSELISCAQCLVDIFDDSVLIIDWIDVMLGFQNPIACLWRIRFICFTRQLAE